jgi:hypothetical protein
MVAADGNQLLKDIVDDLWSAAERRIVQYRDGLGRDRPVLRPLEGASVSLDEGGTAIPDTALGPKNSASVIAS